MTAAEVVFGDGFVGQFVKTAVNGEDKQGNQLDNAVDVAAMDGSARQQEGGNGGQAA